MLTRIVDLEGWERPQRIDQLELFNHGRDRVLAAAQISIDEIERWRDFGWISFDIRDVASLDRGQVSEICFIRNLAHSGLTDLQINGLLGDLERPYRYDPIRTVYSFAFGWVQRPRLLESTKWKITSETTSPLGSKSASRPATLTAWTTFDSRS